MYTVLYSAGQPACCSLTGQQKIVLTLSSGSRAGCFNNVQENVLYFYILVIYNENIVYSDFLSSTVPLVEPQDCLFLLSVSKIQIPAYH